MNVTSEQRAHRNPIQSSLKDNVGSLSNKKQKKKKKKNGLYVHHIQQHAAANCIENNP